MTYRELVALVGESAAETLVRLHGGECLYVPSPGVLLREARLRLIGKSQVVDGLTARDAAEAYGVSESTAKRAKSVYLAMRS